MTGVNEAPVLRAPDLSSRKKGGRPEEQRAGSGPGEDIVGG